MESVTNTTFDPYNQSFILHTPDGNGQFVAKMADVLVLNKLVASQGIIYGTQIGLTSLLFLIMMLMTKRDKRSSWVFIMNCTALVLIFVRNVMACVQLNSLFYNFYNWELHFYPEGSALQSAMNVSASTEVLNTVINAAVYASLVLQVHIVCCTLTRFVKGGLVLMSALVAVAATAVRFVLAVLNIKWSIYGLNELEMWQYNAIGKAADANNIVSVTAIGLFSLVFITKLAFAIHLRRKLNMKQFGPMQIIFVMGCQTMIVPLIFAVIQYYAAKGSQLNSMVPTVVAIFLPLSGMWASAQTNNERLARAESRFHQVVPVGASNLSSAKAYGSSTGKSTMDTADDTLVDDDDLFGNSRTGGRDDTSTPQGKEMTHIVEMSETSDVEQQRLRGAVVVDRTYSVRSD